MSAFRSSRSVLLALLLAAPAPLASQADTAKVLIAGTVIDPLRQPIEGVEVRVIGTELTVMTAPAGTFRLYAPRAKQLLVQFRRPGYNAQLLKLDGEWSGTVLLQPGAFKLPEIEVTARYAKPAKYAGTAKYDDYFRRRRIGFGEFVDREEIERRGALETTRLLEGRSGIKVLYPHDEVASGRWIGAIVAFARCNEFPPKINVYIDGRKLIPRTTPDMIGSKSVFMTLREPPDPAENERRREIRAIVGEMLDRINPSDIELMEIFRGPSELPAEFNDGNCGAISIWTRQGGR